MIDIFDKYIDVYKVGSGDLNNFEIIKKIVSKKKPIIISTGLSSISEITKTVNFVNKVDKNYLKKKKLALLHCNTAYPTPIEDVNLNNIQKLNDKFNIDIGYSDHTIGSEIIKIAFYLGAKIIEKHFSNTVKSKTFRDHQISLNKNGVNVFLKDINKYQSVLGCKKNNLTKSEIFQKNQYSFRRSIYAKNAIKKGEIFSQKNIICLRPFKKKGITASNYFNIIGKISKKNYKINDLI